MTETIRCPSGHRMLRIQFLTELNGTCQSVVAIRECCRNEEVGGWVRTNVSRVKEHPHEYLTFLTRTLCCSHDQCYSLYLSVWLMLQLIGRICQWSVWSECMRSLSTDMPYFTYLWWAIANLSADIIAATCTCMCVSVCLPFSLEKCTQTQSILMQDLGFNLYCFVFGLVHTCVPAQKAGSPGQW